MEKLSGLVLQLKVKTGFIVDDDLEPLLNDEIEKAKIEMRYEDDILQNMILKIAIKQTEINQPNQPPSRIGITQYETWFKETKNITDYPPLSKLIEVIAFKQAYLDKFVQPARRPKDDYSLYRSINAEIDRLKAVIKSNMNTNKIMSTTAFEKLNTISDTIPNIINQILSLAMGISRIVVTKITEWSTEISNKDLSKVIDTSNELIEDIASINSKAGVQPYIIIYKKLKKPNKDIYKSVNEMGKLAGVIPYDENVKNQFKYTNTIGYTNRTGPRPLVPGAAPSARLAPPVATSTRLTPPNLNKAPLIIIKKSIDKIGALFKAGNVPEFMTTFREAFNDLQQTLINEGYLTDQLPGTDPLAIFIDALQESSQDISKTPMDWIVSDDQKKNMDDTFDLNYRYIESLFKSKSAAQSTGASGVGETKGAGKFMHSYHAKRFL
jgi:hypothetical protein